MRQEVGEWAGRYRLVVLEGCNGAGKTTLAAHLATHYGYQVVHSGVSADGVDLMTRYSALIGAVGEIVLDRSFVSEMVYGPILRGHSRLSGDQTLDLARQAAARNGVFVHLVSSPERLIVRMHARPPEGRIDMATIGRLRRAYDLIFAQIMEVAPVVTVDTDRSATW